MGFILRHVRKRGVKYKGKWLKPKDSFDDLIGQKFIFGTYLDSNFLDLWGTPEMAKELKSVGPIETDDDEDEMFLGLDHLTDDFYRKLGNRNLDFWQTDDYWRKCEENLAKAAEISGVERVE